MWFFRIIKIIKFKKYILLVVSNNIIKYKKIISSKSNSKLKKHGYSMVPNILQSFNEFYVIIFLLAILTLITLLYLFLVKMYLLIEEKVGIMISNFTKKFKHFWGIFKNCFSLSRSQRVNFVSISLVLLVLFITSVVVLFPEDNMHSMSRNDVLQFSKLLAVIYGLNIFFIACYFIIIEVDILFNLIISSKKLLFLSDIFLILNLIFLAVSYFILVLCAGLMPDKSSYLWSTLGHLITLSYLFGTCLCLCPISVLLIGLVTAKLSCTAKLLCYVYS